MSLLPLEVARRRVLAQCRPLRPRAVALADALGCVTSVDLRADEPVPPFANTAVDGFALRASDSVGAAGSPVVLAVIGTIAAGSVPEPPVGPGQAVRILTGAPMPAGADAVVMVEHTDAWDGRSGREARGPAGAVAGAAAGASAGSVGPDLGMTNVEVRRAVRAGENVRLAGDDLAAGQVVFRTPTVLGAGHLGVLASMGMRRVPVFGRARVGVLSTGDELVDDGSPLRPGQIRDSNRHTLLALVSAANAEPIDLGVVGDDEDAVAAALHGGLERCDAIVTSGGVSVGDFDYVKVVLDRLSEGTFDWMQVAIRPAKPLAFGVIGGKPVFGLPGNPVSSMVSFELFARPALRQMMGYPDPARPEVGAVADEPFHRNPDGKLHLVRVRAEWSDADGRFHVRSSGGQASHLLRSMALANALVLLPDGAGVEQGDQVKVLLLTWPD